MHSLIPPSIPRTLRMTTAAALIAFSAGFAVAQSGPPVTDEFYAIISVEITNMAKFQEYVAGHLPSVEQYGGTFLAEFLSESSFDADSIQLESNWDMTVIQEWPSEEAFMEWWNSPEYAPWKDVRSDGANVSLTFSRRLAH